MKTVGAFEAKTHLSKLLDEVAAGESVTITKHGKPVARLVPPPEARRTDVQKAIDEWREYRRRHNIRLDGVTIQELIDEGRRY